MQLHDLSALEQAAAVRRREVSSVELVEHYAARIERLDAAVGAFVTRTLDRAREQAEGADRAVAAGDDLPPLHGVPIGIKDLNLTAGVPTKLGSPTFAGFVPPASDSMVGKLESAGTISLGKTNTPEFGLPCYTEPATEIAPPARTPWDLSRSAGGSSGGAGAAVAAGLVPFAQGSDGGGSIRIPASVCGLVGLKPSRGRVSLAPWGDVGGLATSGPIGRTVADVAALLDVLAEPVPGDPNPAHPLEPGETFLPATARVPGRVRIARFRTPVVAEADVHPECVRAYDDASALLAGLGHEVVDVPPPFGPEVVPAFETVWAVLGTLMPVAPAAEPALMPLTRWLRERGTRVTGVQYAVAVATMQIAARRAGAAFAPYDAVLTPTLAQPPVLVGELRDEDDPAADFEANKRFTPFTALWNVTGNPAISLPLHWTPEGLPVGVMLTGRRSGEAELITLVAQIEAAAPWRRRVSPLWR